MRPKNAVLGLGLLFLAISGSTPAFAQATPPKETQSYPSCNHLVSNADSELAHQKYIAGKTDFDEANYDSAIRRFRDAYNLDCTKHELLIIISAAYERKVDRREAAAALEAYVARAASAPDVSTYQARIENLKKQIAAEKPAEKPASEPAASAESQGGHTPYPWILVGAGAAAMVVGLVLLATTPDVPPNCEPATRSCAQTPGETTTQYESRQDQAGAAIDQPIIGYLSLGFGTVAAIGGVVWFLLEPSGSKEPSRTTLRPSLAPGRGFAGLALDGTF
jgi:hypothetical protein